MENYLRAHAKTFGLVLVGGVLAVGVIASVLVGRAEHSAGWGILTAGAIGVMAMFVGTFIALAFGRSPRDR